MGAVLLGTSSWSESSWVGPFYPPGTKPADFLGVYATRFPTVEVDSSYYRLPSRRTVEGWDAKTPEGFTLAAKFPRTIVHGGAGKQPNAAAVLGPRARDEAAEFCGLWRSLGAKAGPLLLQFPYFNKQAFADFDAFAERLDAFLADLPAGLRYAVEVRNRPWLARPLTALLRRHRVALALVDLHYLPHPADVVADLGTDVVTADFAYGRLIGDRDKVEALTTSFDRVVIDQTQRLARWRDVLREIAPSVDRTWIFANNHFAGYAPATVRALAERLGVPLPALDALPGAQGELF